MKRSHSSPIFNVLPVEGCKKDVHLGKKVSKMPFGKEIFLIKCSIQEIRAQGRNFCINFHFMLKSVFSIEKAKILGLKVGALHKANNLRPV